MIGIPPVCGFVSKWYLVNGAVTINEIPLLIALLASTILNAGYFVPVLFNAFFRSPDPGINLDKYSEAPLTMVVPLFFTGVVSVLLGLYPETFMQFINALTGW
jgi:multicomponent Na+:H+ antiporter subunit D